MECATGKGRTEIISYWIDMESGVRTDDWFDLDKVVKVLQICDNVLKSGITNY